jgi:hypothetical protein
MYTWSCFDLGPINFFFTFCFLMVCQVAQNCFYSFQKNAHVMQIDCNDLQFCYFFLLIMFLICSFNCKGAWMNGKYLVVERHHHCLHKHYYYHMHPYCIFFEIVIIATLLLQLFLFLYMKMSCSFYKQDCSHGHVQKCHFFLWAWVLFFSKIVACENFVVVKVYKELLLSLRASICMSSSCTWW